MRVFLRKSYSVLRKLHLIYNSAKIYYYCRFFQEGIFFSGEFSCASNVYISCTDGGELFFGKNVSLGRNVKVVVRGGSIIIGDNSFIGDGSIIIAQKSIHIGDNALIAEYVTIRDQDHSLDNDPINTSGFNKSSIIIENNVWLAAKCTVLKGVHIGEGAVVAAHALVNKSVSARSIVAGVPAKVVSHR